MYRVLLLLYTEKTRKQRIKYPVSGLTKRGIAFILNNELTSAKKQPRRLG